MITLPSYMKSDKARFDFRVPDGLGHFVHPDWDDPELKVEFKDASGVLRFTATVSSSPALVQENDYDAETNPQGGPYVMVDGVDLSEFALGTAEAWVYATYGGVEISPRPTILAAFTVAAQGAQGPLYTTVDRVRGQVPGQWPAEVTDEMVTRAIADAGRKIDAALSSCYQTPFPDISDQPATPELIESIARRLAASQCMAWMGRLNSASQAEPGKSAQQDLEALMPSRQEPPRLRLEGYRGPLGLYRGDIRPEDREAGDVMA